MKPDREDDLTQRVFEQLKKQGPLSPSQISVELLEPLTAVMRALEELRDEGFAGLRPDRDKSRPYPPEETAWGLVARRPQRAAA